MKKSMKFLAILRCSFLLAASFVACGRVDEKSEGEGGEHSVEISKVQNYK